MKRTTFTFTPDDNVDVDTALSRQVSHAINKDLPYFKAGDLSIPEREFNDPSGPILNIYNNKDYPGYQIRVLFKKDDRQYKDLRNSFTRKISNIDPFEFTSSALIFSLPGKLVSVNDGPLPTPEFVVNGRDVFDLTHVLSTLGSSRKPPYINMNYYTFDICIDIKKNGKKYSTLLTWFPSDTKISNAGVFMKKLADQFNYIYAELRMGKLVNGVVIPDEHDCKFYQRYEDENSYDIKMYLLKY